MAKGDHVPQRTCIACRRPQAKADLMRLVRAPTGEVAVAWTGKLAGRGAYLCPSWSCWEEAFKKGRVEHALHTSLSPETRQQLLRRGKELLGLAAAEEAHHA